MASDSSAARAPMRRPVDRAAHDGAGSRSVKALAALRAPLEASLAPTHCRDEAFGRGCGLPPASAGVCQVRRSCRRTATLFTSILLTSAGSDPPGVLGLPTVARGHKDARTHTRARTSNLRIALVILLPPSRQFLRFATNSLNSTKVPLRWTFKTSSKCRSTT